jgi:16S rRNA U516 pseudouridylate synthase RsuA-like enzyme
MDILSAGLDYQSQEPLIFTDDKYLNDSLLNPLHEHERECWVQAGGYIIRKAMPNSWVSTLLSMEKYTLQKMRCQYDFNLLKSQKEIHPSVSKIYPEAGSKIILTAGKNRQVTKLEMKIGFMILRLIPVV